MPHFHTFTLSFQKPQVKGISHNPFKLRELFIRKENTFGLLTMEFTEIYRRHFEEK